MPLKIEPNNFYRTRDGSKSRIYAIDGGGKYCIHGAYWDGEHWVPTTWMISGENNRNLSRHELDLISPWQEPKPRMLAWMHNNERTIRFFDETDGPLLTTIWTRAPWLDEPEKGNE